MWGQVRDALLGLRAFQQNQNLTRQAVYPENRTWHVAVLSAMVLVESLANMTFFAHGLDGGLLAGLLEALVVAGINVAVAFGVGNLMRGLNGRPWMRLLSALGGGLYAGFLGVFHLTVAHYRIALADTLDNAATVAIARFLDAPWG